MNGPLTASQFTVSDNASVNGPVDVDGFTVGGNLAVSGPIQAKGLTVSGMLTVQGPAHIESGKLHEKMVNGPVHLNGVTINGTLNYAATLSVVNNSTLVNVLVRGSDSTPDILCLSNQSQVTGNVTFKGVEGLVYLSDGSAIKGSVSGGKAVNGVCP